jgi:hypothetical protein
MQWLIWTSALLTLIKFLSLILDHATTLTTNLTTLLLSVNAREKPSPQFVHWLDTLSKTYVFSLVRNKSHPPKDLAWPLVTVPNFTDLFAELMVWPMIINACKIVLELLNKLTESVLRSSKDVNFVPKLSCLLVEKMESLIETCVNSNVIKLISRTSENVKTRERILWDAINVLIFLSQFAELMVETIRTVVSVPAEETVKNTVKVNALKKRVALDVQESSLQFVLRKE